MFPQTLVVLLVVAHLGFGTKVVIEKPRFRRNVCASTSVGDMTVINYPGTNGNYLNNAYCDWRVCTNTSSASIRISRMDIEFHPRCSYDAVSIQGFKYCGLNTRNVNVSTSNGCIFVRFTSDGSVTKSGFTLEVRAGQVNTTFVSNPNATFNSSSGSSNSSGNSTLNTGNSFGNFSFSNSSSSNGNSSGNSTIDTGSSFGNFSFGNNSSSNGNSSGNSTIDIGNSFGNFSFSNSSSSNGNSSGNSTIDNGTTFGNFSFGNNSSSNGNSSGNSTIDTGSSFGNFSFSNSSSSNGNSSGNSTIDTGSSFGNFSFGNNSSSSGNSSGNSTIDTGNSFGNFSFSNNSSSNGNSSGNSTVSTGSSFGNSSSGNQSLFNNCVLARNVGGMTEEIDYPGTGDYPNNAFCEWNVCTNTARARISITAMDIESHSSCSYDSLQIKNSKFCGSSTGSYTVTTNQGCVKVGFTSDFSITRTGFTLQISPV